MDGWITFILDRYNYWIFIVLMMTGLYIVFARGNLVKKIVGLNIFQTSVFIYYISIGKIAGGTAPIYMGGELDAAAHHEPEGAEHGAEAGAHETGEAGAALHAKIDNSALDHGQELKEALKHAPDPQASESLHQLPDAGEKVANTALSHADKAPSSTGFDVAGAADPHGAAQGLGDALHGATEAIVYTNPLPHVLILTAIVVGVATTAVGLALAVRIREAYGTIEEDELEAADDIAEFGHEAGRYGADAPGPAGAAQSGARA
jgi:multicomponent Na+:H+ antiporter subunit C